MVIFPKNQEGFLALINGERVIKKERSHQKKRKGSKRGKCEL